MAELVQELREPAGQFGKSMVLCNRAAAEIERLRAALIQIREVCDDNAPASCNQAMALAFVRSVVVHALNNEQKQET